MVRLWFSAGTLWLAQKGTSRQVFASEAKALEWVKS